MLNKIDIIIFTKNRSSQLDLLLRSIRDKFKYAGTIYILYTFSSELFQKGYERVQATDYNLNIVWVRELSFSEDTRKILATMKTTCFLGLCDDDVFVNEVDVTGIPELLDSSYISSFSLKAGLNITHNYPSFKLELPKFVEIKNPDALVWTWKDNPPGVDWGYPTCTNSFIFNVKYYLDLIVGLRFNQTANLEGGLNQRRYMFKPAMACFKESSLLNIPCNRLQTVSDNPHGQMHPFSAEELNGKWLSGKQISTKNIYEHRIFMPNIELPLLFEEQT